MAGAVHICSDSTMKRRDFLSAATQQVAAVTVGHELLRGADLFGYYAPAPQNVVDRAARLARHAPVVRAFDPFSALSVGNGRFAFTADATGLQTFAEEYHDLPLATQAEWGWHSFPNPSGFHLDDALVLYDAHGRQVPYASG